MSYADERLSKPGLLARVCDLLIDLIFALAMLNNHIARFAMKVLRRIVPVGYADQRHSFLGGPAQWAWGERGVFAAQSCPAGGVVLDIASGDGFYDAHYLAPRAAHVDGIDLDPNAIRAARQRYVRPNVAYHNLDAIGEPFPRSRYDLICCFATFQYFDAAQTTTLLTKIAAALDADGAFIGFVPRYVMTVNDKSARTEYRTVAQVREMLRPFFGAIEIFESPISETRTDVYFRCRVSDSATHAQQR